MKRLTLALAFFPVVALPGVAQDDRWSDLALGDRIEITFNSGGTIVGTLVAPKPKIASLDYAKESALVLDLTWEYPGLNGTLTAPKNEIKSVRKLRFLDEQTKRNLAEMKKRVAQETKAPEPKASSPAPVVTPEPAPVVTPEPAPVVKDEPPAAAEKEAKELQKAIDFYDRYPSPFWGPERHTMDVQKQARGQALSTAETEFEKGYPSLWERGRTASLPKADPK